MDKYGKMCTWYSKAHHKQGDNNTYGIPCLRKDGVSNGKLLVKYIKIHKGLNSRAQCLVHCRQDLVFPS